MAVEALIMPRDPEGPPGWYGRGDFVDIQPGGYAWGGEERMAFWIVVITDRDMEQVATFLQRTPTAKSRYWLDTSKLTSTLRNTLFTTGTITVTFNQIQGAITDKGA